MTYKEKVLRRFEKATVEKKIAFAPLNKIRYWEVEVFGYTLGRGKTEAKAWLSAWLEIVAESKVYIKIKDEEQIHSGPRESCYEGNGEFASNH